MKKSIALLALGALTGLANAVAVTSGPQDNVQGSVTPSGFFDQSYIDWETRSCQILASPSCTRFFASYQGSTGVTRVDETQSFDIHTEKNISSVAIEIESGFDFTDTPPPDNLFRWTATDLNTGKLLLDYETNSAFIKLSSLATTDLRLSQYSLVPYVTPPQPGSVPRFMDYAALDVAVVPEPETFALMLAGLVGLAGASRKVRQPQAA